MIMKLTMLSLIVLHSLAANSCSMLEASERQCVSVHRVLADAELLDGEDVAVCGVLRYEFEDRNLYASEQAAREQSDDACLALGMAEGFSGNLGKLNGETVRILGLATSDFCPEGTLCTASCSDTGVFVKAIEPF